MNVELSSSKIVCHEILKNLVCPAIYPIEEREVIGSRFSQGQWHKRNADSLGMNFRVDNRRITIYFSLTPGNNWTFFG